MNAIDARMQPQDGQRRLHRHLEDAPANDYPPASGISNLLMSDAQGTFGFSVEPTAMVYDNSTMALSSSSTTGQDSGFTTNAESSFGSTLQPNMVALILHLMPTVRDRAFLPGPTPTSAKPSHRHNRQSILVRRLDMGATSTSKT